MLRVEDWAEIRRLRRSERMSISEIARVVGCSRNTVKRALASDEPPRYRRRPAGSVVDAYEPRIRELLRAYPSMPATVIAERIGWPHSIRTLRDRVALLRPVYLPPDPASRTSYVAGEIAQCDFWFPPIELPVGFGQKRTAKQLPVLTMVCGYSRWASAVLIPTRRAEDLYAGWWQLIDVLGAVPRVLVWDGEGAVGRWRGATQRADRRVSGVPRHAGHQGAHLWPGRSGGQGPGRAATRLPGTLVPAGPSVRVAGGVQRAAAYVSGRREHPPAPGVGVSTGRSCRRRPGGDGGVAAGAASGGLAPVDPAATRPLRAAGQQRLLGAPGRHRTTG